MPFCGASKLQRQQPRRTLLFLLLQPLHILCIVALASMTGCFTVTNESGVTPTPIEMMSSWLLDLWEHGQNTRWQRTGCLWNSININGFLNGTRQHYYLQESLMVVHILLSASNTWLATMICTGKSADNNHGVKNDAKMRLKSKSSLLYPLFLLLGDTASFMTLRSIRSDIVASSFEANTFGWNPSLESTLTATWASIPSTVRAAPDHAPYAIIPAVPSHKPNRRISKARGRSYLSLRRWMPPIWQQQRPQQPNHHSDDIRLRSNGSVTTIVQYHLDIEYLSVLSNILAFLLLSRLALVLRRLLTHPNAFVRWTSRTAMGTLDLALVVTICVSMGVGAAEEDGFGGRQEEWLWAKPSFLSSSSLVARLAISCRTTVSKLLRAAAMHPAYNSASIPSRIWARSHSGRDSYHWTPGDTALVDPTSKASSTLESLAS